MAPVDFQNMVDEIARRRGFFWPSFEIYGGLSGFYTYGDLGTKLKRNIEDAWREFFVRRQGFLELEDPIINPSRVFEASGHLEHFKDYMAECARCGLVFRADHIVEDAIGLEKEVFSMKDFARYLREGEVRCPECGGEFKEPIMILTMFQTTIGAAGGEVGFARPEAAQGMFINFRRGFQYARERLPFALAQVGKVLRNEISPRRGLLRLREFTIMELELFFDPQEPSCSIFSDVSGEEVRLLTEEMEESMERTPLELTLAEAVDGGLIQTEWQAYFMGISKRFVSHLGVPDQRQRFRAHLPVERSHYSTQTFDHEVRLESWGWTEVAGHAYRTDYDLKAHKQVAGVDLSVLRPDGNRVVPHAVEPSFGLDRLVHVALESSYMRREKRNILALPRDLAPISVSVLPLVTRDGLPEKAAEVHGMLVDAGLVAAYDDSGSIGRLYARSDEIGTPLAITIDYETLEDGTVTLRDRDSWSQVRQEIKNLTGLLLGYFKGEMEFSDLGSPV